MGDVMDRKRGQHDIQAVERDRLVSPKQKKNGDLPILHQQLHSSTWTFDAPSPSECDVLLSRNRSPSIAASTLERLACSRVAVRAIRTTGIGTRSDELATDFARNVISQN
jgi:hypothetical protein